VGLPAAGPRPYQDTLTLVQQTVDAEMKIRPNAAARTMVRDIEPIADISQKTGVPVEVAMFVGSSPIRLYTESWGLDHLQRITEEAVTFAVKNALPVMFVTEDTTRATPETLRALYTCAIEHGARRITIADTVGHADPTGVRAVVRYIRSVVDETGEDVKIDWHGHNDRGLGVVNSLTAAWSGVDQVHGTALGIGERSGNAAMDQILINLKLMGLIDNDLTRLTEYCDLVSKSVGIDVSPNYPIVGRDAFRTATGVHAAAVIKAAKLGDAWLEDMIYSSVPATMIGREQTIEVGPMSGVSNVSYWLTQRGYEADPALVDAIFKRAKQSKAVLEESEILGIVREFGEPAKG